MKRTLLALGTFFVGASAFAQNCSELFISEYVEGWGNNKALEIYNPTGTAVDLSQYMVVRYSNGATSATAANAIQLSGTVAPKDVFVGVLEKLDPNGTGQETPIWDSLEARADAFFCADYNTSNAWYWNGNDAVVLYKGTTSDISNAIIVDIFGKIGEDPGPGTGWSTAFPYNNGAGVVVSADHSLIRKSTILKGEVNPTISFFDPLAEYDSIPAVVDIGGQTYGNWFTLGSHDCDCETLGTDDVKAIAKVSVYPNPSTGQFTVANIADFSGVQVINSLGQEVEHIDNNTQAVISFDFSSKRGV